MSDPTLASHLRIITQLVEYAESKDVRADRAARGVVL